MGVDTVILAVGFLTVIGLVIFGSPYQTAKTIEETHGRIRTMQKRDDQRDENLSRLVGGIEAIVDECRRLADSCQRMAAASEETAEGSKEAAAAAIAIQHNAQKMVTIVDQLARRVLAAIPETAAKS